MSPEATHFGAITYSTYSKLEFDFADARYHKIVELKRRVMAIRYPGGWTRTDRALEMAAQKLFTVAGGDRKDKRNVLVVFTDGKTNRGSKSYMEVLRPLQVGIDETSTLFLFAVSKLPLESFKISSTLFYKVENVIAVHLGNHIHD